MEPPKWLHSVQDTMCPLLTQWAFHGQSSVMSSSVWTHFHVLFITLLRRAMIFFLGHLTLLGGSKSNSWVSAAPAQRLTRPESLKKGQSKENRLTVPSLIKTAASLASEERDINIGVAFLLLLRYKCGWCAQTVHVSDGKNANFFHADEKSKNSNWLTEFLGSFSSFCWLLYFRYPQI